MCSLLLRLHMKRVGSLLFVKRQLASVKKEAGVHFLVEDEIGRKRRKHFLFLWERRV